MAEIDTQQTRDKFGVPIIDQTTGAGILMPKLQYRFRVLLLDFGNNVDPIAITRNVVSVTRPKVSYPEIELHSYNSRTYIHGKHQWETIELVVRDDITNSVTRAVGSQVQRQVNHFQQSTPASGSEYKFDMQIETLNGTNNQTDQETGTTEVFFLEGCFLQNVDYGSMDYSVSEAVQLSLAIRFDNCTHYQGDDGLGIGGNPFPDAPITVTPGSAQS